MMLSRTGRFGSLLTLTIVASVGTVWASPKTDYEQGCKSYQARDYETARATLTKASEAQPKHWASHYQLANTLIQLKQYPEARAAYNKCLGSKPPAEIADHCMKAVSFLTNAEAQAAQTAKAPPAPAAEPEKKEEKAAPPEPPAQAKRRQEQEKAAAQLETRRKRILDDAQVEAKRIRDDMDIKIKEARENWNDWALEDGQMKSRFPADKEQEMKTEAEEEANKVIQQAEKRAAALR